MNKIFLGQSGCGKTNMIKQEVLKAAGSNNNKIVILGKAEELNIFSPDIVDFYDINSISGIFDLFSKVEDIYNSTIFLDAMELLANETSILEKVSLLLTQSRTHSNTIYYFHRDFEIKDADNDWLIRKLPLNTNELYVGKCNEHTAYILKEIAGITELPEYKNGEFINILEVKEPEEHIKINEFGIGKSHTSKTY